MRNILIILGILSIIGGIVLGFSDMMKYLKLTVECISGGIVQSITYFALAYLADKADKSKVQQMANYDNLRKLLMEGFGFKQCPICGNNYGRENAVCPKCNR